MIYPPPVGSYPPYKHANEHKITGEDPITEIGFVVQVPIPIYDSNVTFAVDSTGVKWESKYPIYWGDLNFEELRQSYKLVAISLYISYDVDVTDATVKIGIKDRLTDEEIFSVEFTERNLDYYDTKVLTDADYDKMYSGGIPFAEVVQASNTSGATATLNFLCVVLYWVI